MEDSTQLREVMNTKEVADYLGVDESTVTRAAKRGEIPAKKLGHLWLYHRTRIQQWFGLSSSPEGTQ